ncbi:MAG TPA: hypothetical protein DDZ96_02565 [Porphyromonadaceae bacterium]|jgi:hypothetical protein|uniref:DUF3823 domain-containing protein n=1 Tax=Limibacterium fermenti TaxID=3229863 RepID=UPI000E967C52|nr:hypothetical protein [Porphyromonadaceae bacterium]HBL32689.1 hypothetical protein [Porphyromonadaceae bacterium]HBX21917.1 hypothetical protein [Porphyromonadaceae bacterium]HBX44289.1 hypothetical protein [Porphyromonadaceae bacterium]HCM21446.1 hypothetical protein [Porphyromonadaceae bacterium]
MKIKHPKYILSIAIVALALTSCGLDNYDAPQSKLNGKITYNGLALGVRGTGEAVQVQLYQDGYDLKNHISVYVGQDGTFEALLFDGEYKLVTRDNNGPWVNKRDTVIVNVKGNTEVELPVTPYFTISDETLSLNGSVLNATFKINEIVSTAQIEYVMLLVSKTTFVDDATNIARKDFTDQQAGSVTLSLNMEENKDFASAKVLFARVGVKTVGTDQAVYSKIVRLK